MVSILFFFSSSFSQREISREELFCSSSYPKNVRVCSFLGVCKGRGGVSLSDTSATKEEEEEKFSKESDDIDTHQEEEGREGGRKGRHLN